MSVLLSSSEPSAHAEKPKSCLIVVVCAPKGGVGKTTIVRNLLVSAAHTNISAIGINMDEQQTLSRWATVRSSACEKFSELRPVVVTQCSINDYRQAVRTLYGYDIAFVDTPPGHGPFASAIANLCETADLVLVPTSTTHDDVAEVRPFMQRVAREKGAFVLNRVNKRTTSFLEGRTALVAAGAVCPVEIPQLEDIHQWAAYGMTAFDAPKKALGINELNGVWNFVCQRVGLSCV